MRRLKVCGATWIAVGLAAVGSANAQTIYPINRADILSGSRFDFKVELPGAPAAGQVRVTLNGQDPSAVLGKPAEFVVNEDGGDHSAFWIRQAEIKSPGRYVIEVQLGEAKTSVTWNVFDTPTRRAKNVVLVVGDGMTVAHRTAARARSPGRSSRRMWTC